eukprot:187103_1
MSSVYAVFMTLYNSLKRLILYLSSKKKYILLFFIGHVSSHLMAYHIASKLTGLNYLQLFAQIMIKFQQRKYTKNKQIGYNKWKKCFPKAKTIPSEELMNMWDTYNELQLFNLTRVKNNYKKLISTMRFILKITIKTLPIHPSCVSKPKIINFEHFNAMQLNYPGCSINNGIILYIHGGGFVWSTYEYGLPMLYKLMSKTGYIGIAINYRISPEHNILDAVDDCINCYKYIINNYKTNNILFIGDSAGGCLTLLTLQALNTKKYNLKQANGAVILSAVCDLSCDHKSFIYNKQYDPVLQKSGLNAAYQMGLGNIDINGNLTGNDQNAKSPLYSPLYGNFKGLCPLYFSSGIHEILFDENVKTMKKAESEGVNVTYEWNEWMVHCTAIWVAYKIPEAQDVLSNIAFWMKQLNNAP